MMGRMIVKLISCMHVKMVSLVGGTATEWTTMVEETTSLE